MISHSRELVTWIGVKEIFSECLLKRLLYDYFYIAFPIHRFDSSNSLESFVPNHSSCLASYAKEQVWQVNSLSSIFIRFFN